MRNPEQGKIIGLIKQLAKETIGVGAAQRFKSGYIGSDRDSMEANIGVVAHATGQIITPVIVRFIETNPRLQGERPTNSQMFLAILADLGIDSISVLLAVNGNIDEGAATKLVYNAGANLVLEMTKNFSIKSIQKIGLRD